LRGHIFCGGGIPAVRIIGGEDRMREGTGDSSGVQIGRPWRPESVRTLREKKGWKQETLRVKAGVTQQAISYAENGGMLSEGTAEKLSKAFGVPPRSLRIEHNLAVILGELERGRMGPKRAAKLAAGLEEVLWEHEMSLRQRLVFLEALGRLRTVIWAAQQRRMSRAQRDAFRGALEKISAAVSEAAGSGETSEEERIFLHLFLERADAMREILGRST
jgi:transcriptional regulator with XRE-family HTH domain